MLYDHLTCTKQFRLFTKAEGAEGHCEGMAPTVFWDAAYDWLDTAPEPGGLTSASPRSFRPRAGENRIGLAGTSAPIPRL
jgi:hypothetical protein